MLLDTVFLYIVILSDLVPKIKIKNRGGILVMIFGLNEVHVKVSDAILAGKCTEFRHGPNGTTPEPQNPKKSTKKLKITN